MNRLLLGTVVQLIRNDWDVIRKFCSAGALQAVKEPHMWLNPAVIRFQVHSQPSTELVSCRQQGTFFDAELLLLERKGVVATARYRTWEDEEINWFLCYFMLKGVRDLVSNNAL